MGQTIFMTCSKDRWTIPGRSTENQRQKPIPKLTLKGATKFFQVVTFDQDQPWNPKEITCCSFFENEIKIETKTKIWKMVAKCPRIASCWVTIGVKSSIHFIVMPICSLLIVLVEIWKWLLLIFLIVKVAGFLLCLRILTFFATCWQMPCSYADQDPLTTDSSLEKLKC